METRVGQQGPLGYLGRIVGYGLAANLIVGCALPPPAEEKPLTGELETPYEVDSTVGAVDSGAQGIDARVDSGQDLTEDTGSESKAASSEVGEQADPSANPSGSAVAESAAGGAEVAEPSGPDGQVPPATSEDGSSEVAAAGDELTPAKDEGLAGDGIEGLSGEAPAEEATIGVRDTSGADLKPIADASETLAEAPAPVDAKALERDPDAAPAVGVEESLEPEELDGTADASARTESSETEAGDEPFQPRQHETDDGLLMTYESFTLAPLSTVGVDTSEGGEEGDLPAVVFIHGWCGNRSQWDPHMKALASDYRVLSLDLLGHGDSPAAGDAGEWTVPRFGLDVAGLIEAENLTDVVLVGHAMGGQVALEVALRLPERISGVIGVESLHELNVAKQPDDDTAEFETFVRPFEKDFRVAFLDFVQNATDETTSEETRADLLDDAVSCDPSIAVKLMRHFQTRDLKRVVRNVECPVYCINSTLVETDIEGNRVLLTGFDAEQMPDVGFWPHVEAPAAFQSLLVTRLNSLGEPRKALDPVALTGLWPILYVEDVEAIEAFYVTHLKFKRVSPLPVDADAPASLITMERDGQRIGLQSLTTLAGDLPGVESVKEGGQVLFVTVTDLESERQSVGPEVDWVVPLRTLDSKSKQAILLDPVKNVIVLQQPPKRPLGQD